MATLRDFGFGNLCDTFDKMRNEISNRKSMYAYAQSNKIIYQFKLSEFGLGYYYGN